MLRRVLAIMFVFGLLSTAPVLVSLGVFGDTAEVGDNPLGTGTISLATLPASGFLSLSDMLPGDSVVASLTVENDGTGELRYAMSASASEAVLAAALDLKVKSGLGTCDAESMDDAGLGTVLADGGLTSVGIGDPAQGEQAGDRTLSAGADETLCFEVSLPLSADDALQGLSTTVSFTFTAEQTKNNA